MSETTGTGNAATLQFPGDTPTRLRGLINTITPVSPPSLVDSIIARLQIAASLGIELDSSSIYEAARTLGNARLLSSLSKIWEIEASPTDLTLLTASASAHTKEINQAEPWFNNLKAVAGMLEEESKHLGSVLVAAVVDSGVLRWLDQLCEELGIQASESDVSKTVLNWYIGSMQGRHLSKTDHEKYMLEQGLRVSKEAITRLLCHELDPHRYMGASSMTRAVNWRSLWLTKAKTEDPNTPDNAWPDETIKLIGDCELEILAPHVNVLPVEVCEKVLGKYLGRHRGALQEKETVSIDSLTAFLAFREHRQLTREEVMLFLNNISDEKRARAVLRQMLADTLVPEPLPWYQIWFYACHSGFSQMAKDVAPKIEVLTREHLEESFSKAQPFLLSFPGLKGMVAERDQTFLQTKIRERGLELYLKQHASSYNSPSNNFSWMEGSQTSPLIDQVARAIGKLWLMERIPAHIKEDGAHDYYTERAVEIATEHLRLLIEMGAPPPTINSLFRMALDLPRTIATRICTDLLPVAIPRKLEKGLIRQLLSKTSHLYQVVELPEPSIIMSGLTEGVIRAEIAELIVGIFCKQESFPYRKDDRDRSPHLLLELLNSAVRYTRDKKKLSSLVAWLIKQKMLFTASMTAAHRLGDKPAKLFTTKEVDLLIDALEGHDFKDLSSAEQLLLIVKGVSAQLNWSRVVRSWTSGPAIAQQALALLLQSQPGIISELEVNASDLAHSLVSIKSN